MFNSKTFFGIQQKSKLLFKFALIFPTASKLFPVNVLIPDLSYPSISLEENDSRRTPPYLSLSHKLGLSHFFFQFTIFISSKKL